MADVLVPPRYETDYLYELRAIAENISRERCQHSEVNTTAAVLIPQYIPQCGLQVTDACEPDNVCNVGTPQASEVVTPEVEPESKESAEDPHSGDADARSEPAWDIPMTQDKSLQELPSQLDLDWQESVLPTPMPSLAAVRNLGEELEVVGATRNADPPVVLDTFAEVSQIAQESVMGATQ